MSYDLKWFNKEEIPCFKIVSTKKQLAEAFLDIGDNIILLKMTQNHPKWLFDAVIKHNEKIEKNESK